MKALLCSRWLMATFAALCLPAAAADSPVTLQVAFKEQFLMGTAVNRSMVMGGTGRRSAEQLAQDVAVLKAQFNQISPENDLKWQLVHPREGAEGYDFKPADA